MHQTRLAARSLLILLVLVPFALPARPAAAGPPPTAPDAPNALVQMSPDLDGQRLAWTRGESFHLTPNRVAALAALDFADSQARIAWWSEIDAAGHASAYYAISLDGQHTAAVQSADYLVRLRHGEFEPLAGVPAVEPLFEAGPECELFIVQFVTQPLEEYRLALRAAGATILRYFPDHAYIVRLTPPVHAAVAAMPFVRWVGPYHPAYRLEEFLLANAAAAETLFPLHRYNVELVDSHRATKLAVAERIRQIGGVVDLDDAGKYLIWATLTPLQLWDVARWNEVLWLDRWGPPELDMDIAREFSGDVYVQQLTGYNGEGVRAEVMDGNILETHTDFQNPPIQFHGPHSGDPDHGTSTYGINFGQGISCQVGILPKAQGIFADLSFLTNRYLHTQELVDPDLPYQAVYQSNSWGGSLTSSYTSTTAAMDALLFDFDIIICQSQSNFGSTASRPEAWAKNIVAVGGINHQNTLSTADDCWCSGASIGPAADGRIKPDMAHYYDNTATTDGDSNTDCTSTFGGTSGATPITAGHFGLFFQMWSEGVFGNLTDRNGTVFQNRPHMTTAKAMAINTAIQWPFSGTTHDLTRVHQGWGAISAKNMYDLRNKMLIVDETQLLSNFASRTHLVKVALGEPALRATMTYADPEGTTSATQHRINDLTLRVTSPTGVIYWGNNGLLAGNWSISGGAANTKDTVENVFVQNPTPGVWQIRVSADEINQDSHVETPQTDADYALVVSGVSPCVPNGDLNGNGLTDGADLPAFVAAVISNSAAAATLCAADFSGDGVMNPPDVPGMLAELLNP